MSARQPRTPHWREYYDLHTDVLASWAEQQGHQPPHEPGCEGPDPKRYCWCVVFCGYCDHHTEEHRYDVARGAPVPCAQCPGGVCVRG